MKKTKIALVLVVAGIFCLAGFALLAFYLISSNEMDNRNPARQEEMMKLVLEWGRLAPFPASATDVSVKTEGSSFTRSFHASFTAPRQDIEAWIKASPGLREAATQELPDNKVKYTITPGGGANKAEVIIDFTLNTVDILVSWS